MFLFSKTSTPALWPPMQPTLQWVPGFFPGVKRPGYEFNNLPQSRVEVQNDWSYPSTHPIRLHGVDDENRSGSEVPLILKLDTKRRRIVWCVGRYILGKHLVSKVSASQTLQETTGNAEVKSYSCQESNAGIRSDILTNIPYHNTKASSKRRNPFIRGFPLAACLLSSCGHLWCTRFTPQCLYNRCGLLILRQMHTFLQDYLYYPRPNYKCH
jgi:hypothetical protein